MWALPPRMPIFASAWSMISPPLWSCPQYPEAVHHSFFFFFCSLGILYGIIVTISWALTRYQALCLTKRLTDVISSNLPSSPMRSWGTFHTVFSFIVFMSRSSLEETSLIHLIWTTSSHKVWSNQVLSKYFWVSEWWNESNEINKYNRVP